MYRQSDQVLQERLGIGMSQFKLLMMLNHEPNVQQRTLADNLGQTEASISRQIKLLIERGMLVINVNPANRREHIATPTAKGIKVADAAQEILNEYHGPVFDQFTEKQLEQMTQMITLMHEAICGSGKPHACGRAFGIEAIYDSQH
jgi:DNA-binding MarR family transcriptional regulator